MHQISTDRSGRPTAASSVGVPADAPPCCRSPELRLATCAPVAFRGKLVAPLLIAGTCLASTAGAGIEYGFDDEVRERIVRYEYDASPDMPDEMALSTILRILSGVNDHGRGDAVAIVQQEMGLSSSESEQVVDYLLAKSESLSDDEALMFQRFVCPTDRARPVGDEIFAVFDATDDARRGLRTQYLATIRVELGMEKAARLELWLESTKLSSAHVSYWHKEAYEYFGIDPDVRLDQICLGILSNPPND